MKGDPSYCYQKESTLLKTLNLAAHCVKDYVNMVIQLAK